MRNEFVAYWAIMNGPQAFVGDKSASDFNIFNANYYNCECNI